MTDARRLGLRSERSVGLWAYLALAGGREIVTDPQVRAGVVSHPGGPDMGLRVLLGGMRALAAGPAGGG